MGIVEKIDFFSSYLFHQYAVEKLNIFDVHEKSNQPDLTAEACYSHRQKCDRNKSAPQSEQKEPEFKFENSVDNTQQHQKNDTIMMPHNAVQTTSSSSDSAASRLWLPASNHPVIAPKEFEDWIKIYDKINTIASPLPLKRKKSILSTVTYSAEVEDNSNSSGGSSEDDITPPTTPTNEPIFIILSEPTQQQNNTKSTIVGNEHQYTGNKNDSLLCRQAKYTRGNNEQQLQGNEIATTTAEQHNKVHIGKSLVSTATNSDYNTQQIAELQQQEHIDARQRCNPSLIQTPDIVNQSITKSDNVDRKNNNRKSWFGGLFNGTKKTNTLTKKASLSNIFSKTLNKSATNILANSIAPTKANPNNNNQQSASNLSVAAISSTTSNNTTTFSEKFCKKQPQNKAKIPTIAQSSPSYKAKILQQQPQTQQQALISRYPLDTERAIYKLSHTKLRNTRRPLHQQVLISNLMYWYLSITERKKSNQKTYYQKQQQPLDYYHAIKSKRQQIHQSNHVYQATYQSFEPPAPGGDISNYYQQKAALSAYYILPPSSKITPSSSPPPPPLKSDTIKNNSSKKKKYEPVRNTQYVSPV